MFENNVIWVVREWSNCLDIYLVVMFLNYNDDNISNMFIMWNSSIFILGIIKNCLIVFEN